MAGRLADLLQPPRAAWTSVAPRSWPGCRRLRPSTTRRCTRTARGSAATRCSTDVLAGLHRAHQRRRAKAAGLGARPGRAIHTVHDPYFFDYVQQQLIRRYGVRTVRDGGLMVHTTLDPRLQALAQAAVDDGAARLGGPSAALVATDVATGHVLAMASSTDYASDQFNIAAQGHRQPGSSFKPFVLATALKQGVDPNKTYYDGTSPVTLVSVRPRGRAVDGQQRRAGRGADERRPGDHQLGQRRLRAARPRRRAPERRRDGASLGITSPLDGYPAEGIGGLRVGVSPLEMSDAYATSPTAGSTTTRPRSTGRFPRRRSEVDRSARPPNASPPRGIAAEETTC